MENKKLNAKAVKNFLSNNAIIILIFVLALIVGFIADNFWTSSNFKNLIVNVSPRFIIACGVSGCLITKGTAPGTGGRFAHPGAHRTRTRTGYGRVFSGGAGRIPHQGGGPDRKPHRRPDREIPSVRAYLKAQRASRTGYF